MTKPPATPPAGGEEAPAPIVTDTPDAPEPTAAPPPVQLGPVNGPTRLDDIPVINKRRWLMEDTASDAEGPLPELNLKPTYVQELEQRVQLAETRFQERKAWFEEETRRIQERLTREAGRRLEEERGQIVLDLVEVLDTLDLALTAAREGENPEQWLRGVELVREQFFNKLQRMGLTEMGQLDEPFDPTVHEAIEMREVSDPAGDGRVASVWQKGYRLGDRLIRPARVSVGRHSSGAR